MADKILENKIPNGICLNCGPARFVGDKEYEKKLRERVYEAVKDECCGDCGDQLYRLRKKK